MRDFQIPSLLSKEAIEELPFGFMLSDAIRDQTGKIVDFRHRMFNQRAANDLPGLAHWFEGATMWDLFPEDARNGLFDIYVAVCDSGVSNQDDYYSPTTGRQYHSLLERAGDGVIAVGIPIPTSSLRPVIAVIDDDEDDGLLLRHQLKKHPDPITVEQFETSQQFLQVAGGSGMAPLLILVDLRLPTEDIPGVLNRLRKGNPSLQLSRTPIVIWSTAMSEQEKKACYDAGATLVIEKGEYELDTLLDLTKTQGT